MQQTADFINKAADWQLRVYVTQVQHNATIDIITILVFAP